MSDSISAVLFDVDGTLIDSNYLHAVTWWEAFTQGGHDVPMARIHRAVGMGSDQLLDALLPARRDKEDDPGLVAAHDALPHQGGELSQFVTFLTASALPIPPSCLPDKSGSRHDRGDAGS